MVSAKNVQMQDTNIVKVDIGRIKDVFGDARGCYDFLTMECEYFLPSFAVTNLKWMAGIWCGKLKVRYML